MNNFLAFYPIFYFLAFPCSSYANDTVQIEFNFEPHHTFSIGHEMKGISKNFLLDSLKSYKTRTKDENVIFSFKSNMKLTIRTCNEFWDIFKTAEIRVVHFWIPLSLPPPDDPNVKDGFCDIIEKLKSK